MINRDATKTPSWQLGSPHRSAQKQLRDVLRKIPSRYRKAACRQAQAELVLEEYRNAQEQTPVCEYLYGRWRSPEEGDIHVRGYVGGYLDRDPITAKVLPKFRVVKKTAKRIYYVRQEYSTARGYEIKQEIGAVDRQEIERQGFVHNTSRWWLKDDHDLYLRAPGGSPVHIDDACVAKLKAEMALAHPDHGGNDAAFSEARKRYVDARRKMRQNQSVYGE